MFCTSKDTNSVYFATKDKGFLQPGRQQIVKILWKKIGVHISIMSALWDKLKILSKRERLKKTLSDT